MASAIRHSTNYHLLNLLCSQISSKPCIVSQVSIAPSLSAKNIVRKVIKHAPSPRASAEGIPTELIEDSKFVPINSDDPIYGPPVSSGFVAVELSSGGEVKIRQFLKDMGGEFLEVIFCTEDMMSRSLWEAMHTKQPNLKAVKIAPSLPRICFLSGLSGEEMMMLIDAFPETGLEPAVFAALVPNSADKPLQELIEEIMGDHEMLTGEQSNPM